MELLLAMQGVLAVTFMLIEWAIWPQPLGGWNPSRYGVWP